VSQRASHVQGQPPVTGQPAASAQPSDNRFTPLGWSVSGLGDLQDPMLFHTPMAAAELAKVFGALGCPPAGEITTSKALDTGMTTVEYAVRSEELPIAIQRNISATGLTAAHEVHARLEVDQDSVVRSASFTLMSPGTSIVAEARISLLEADLSGLPRITHVNPNASQMQVSSSVPTKRGVSPHAPQGHRPQQHPRTASPEHTYQVPMDDYDYNDGYDANAHMDTSNVLSGPGLTRYDPSRVGDNVNAPLRETNTPTPPGLDAAQLAHARHSVTVFLNGLSNEQQQYLVRAFGRLQLIETDITQLHANDPTSAIMVNAANTRMRGGDGIDGAIHKAAGPGLLDYEKHYDLSCSEGNVQLTPSFTQ
jgi:hypothetical protein